MFGRPKDSLPRSYLPLSSGPPAADTITAGRVFQRLDIARFNACLMAWLREALPAGAAHPLSLCGWQNPARQCPKSLARGRGQCLGKQPAWFIEKVLP